MRYNNYHKHTHYSNIFTPDCNVHPEEYIKKCVEYGHTNYFTTEHGSCGDIFESYSLCQKYGLRCIVGMEGYIVPDPLEKDRSNYHIIIIPQTNKARKKLNVISSRANIEGYYYKPRIFLSDLLQLDKDDVFITTACVAGLLRDETSIEKLFLPLANHFKENLFLEVQNHDDIMQKEINTKALSLHKEMGLKLIAANDSHYVNFEDYKERIELLKGKHITYDEEDGFVLDFPTYETMVERFKKQGVLSEEEIITSINNTLIFDNCEELRLDYDIKMPTIYPNLTPKERVDLLQEIVDQKFNEIIKVENLTEEEINRRKQGIEYEMQTVRDTNEVVHTADYFLFNTKMVDIAVNKYNGVLTRGGRGSCGSFYINKLLGMTQLDRFTINLPIFPDRFASTARLLENRAIPDIDFNVMEQQPFVRATQDLLGENGCYPMIAYGTMQLSEAFRNVCRSKNMDYDEFNDVAKDIELYMDDKKWQPIIEEAQRYVGTIVSASVHPCAHLLSDKNIIEEYGVVRMGDFLCVMITSNEADEFKFLKNDYLIVKVWKLIYETFKEIGIPIISAKELLDSIKDDTEVWKLFENGITCTLNQVDSDNGMNQAKRFGIKSFEDGALIAAAIRPSFDAWREKFLRHEEYSTGSKDLDQVLEQTHHYILYQESLMAYFDWLGITPAESIGLIKKISKKKIKPEDFENLEQTLRTNWIKNTGSENMFDETWEMVNGCMAYGFCSAHASATSLDMCYGAYLKVHYPYEYYSVCFNNYIGDEERTIKLTKELEYFGIKLSNIKFRHSKAKYSYDKEQKIIYKGMASIKYLNEKSSDEIYELRNNVYENFVDLLIDLKEKTSINNKQLTILIKLNFFSEFGSSITDLLWITEIFNKLYGKKNIKKEKAEELDIPFHICEMFANKITDKQCSNVDMVGLSRYLYDHCDSENTPTKDIIKYQQEYLGYIDYKDETLDWKYVVVTRLNTTYSPKFTGYCLQNGKTTEFKIHKKQPRSYPGKQQKEEITSFNDIPFENGDVLYITKVVQQPKKRLIDGEWTPTGEKEWWIKKYKKVEI